MSLYFSLSLYSWYRAGCEWPKAPEDSNGPLAVTDGIGISSVSHRYQYHHLQRYRYLIGIVSLRYRYPT